MAATDVLTMMVVLTMMIPYSRHCKTIPNFQECWTIYYTVINRTFERLTRLTVVLLLLLCLHLHCRSSGDGEVTEKGVWLVPDKIDNADLDYAASEFYSYIGKNIKSLLEIRRQENQ